MNKVPVTVHALFFIALSCVEDFAVGQHCSPFIWYMEDIPVAFQTLVVFKRGIGLFTILFVIILILNKMYDYIFDPVGRLCIKEIKCVVGGRQMAVHTIRDKALGIVNVC